ncbi:hypothetical protein [Aminipila sp.]|uniref:hypothetical protein n=1 Tax=Aminipila sp. TaxID=2060095 RepID=UPI0028A1855C|nr:hypothetical protein [Aminipila sp.]
MASQLPENIFIITEPLHYTIIFSKPTIINLPISTITIDPTLFDNLTLNLHFSGIVTSSSTLKSEMTYIFSLFEADNPVPITTFNYVQLLNTANTLQNSSVLLKYELSGSLSENYRLDLTSISSDADLDIEFIINSGTIVGYVVPQI